MKKIFVVVSLLFMLFLGFTNWQPVEIKDFTGGINNSAAKDNLKGNEFLKLTNFILRDGKLQTREGYSYYLRNTIFGNYPVEYISMYQTEALWKFIVSDGINVWVVSDSSDFDSIYSPFDYSEYTASIAAGDSIVYGSSDSLKWLSVFGYGDQGLNFIIDTGGAPDTFTISHIMNDTMLILTEACPNDLVDSTFAIPIDFGKVHGGINWGQVSYVAADRGLMRYDGNGFTVIDSAFEPYRYYVDTLKTYGDHIALMFDDTDPGCGSCSTWTSGQFNGWYWQFSTGNITQDSGKSRYSDHYYKTMQKIYYTAPCSLYVQGGANLYGPFHQPWDNWGYISLRDAKYKAGPLYKTTDTNFCIIIAGEGTDSGAVAYFASDVSLIAAGVDSAYFEPGNIGLHIQDVPYYDGRIFFIGGVNPDTIGKWECWPIIVPWNLGGLSAAQDTTWLYTDKNFYFYDYNLNKGASSSDNAYEYLERNWSRLFWKPVGLYQTVRCSEPFMPESTLAGNEFTIETGDGDAITGIKKMGDRLLIYKNYSVSELYPTTLAYTEESQEGPFAVRFLTDEIGCIAPKTLVGSNQHYFLSAKGFVIYQGGASAQILSNPISKWLDDSLDITRVTRAAAVMTADGKDIWLSMPSKSGSLHNQATFVLNLETGAWTRFDFAFNYAVTNKRMGQDYSLFFTDADSGRIYSYGGDYDNGDSISAIIQTGYVNFGLPERYIHSRDVVYNYEKPSSATVKLITGFYDDFNSSIVWADTTTNTESFGQNNVFCDPSVYGRNLSMQIKITNAHDVKIPFIKWFLQAGGYIK